MAGTGYALQASPVTPIRHAGGGRWRARLRLKPLSPRQAIAIRLRALAGAIVTAGAIAIILYGRSALYGGP